MVSPASPVGGSVEVFRPTHVESTPLGVTMESAWNNHGSHQGATLIKRTTKYVALDVHQATTVASVREEGALPGSNVTADSPWR